jgi:hypothetical protein
LPQDAIVWRSPDERRRSCQTVALAQATWGNNEDMTIHIVKYGPKAWTEGMKGDSQAYSLVS